jgi:acetyl-CoA carboxylase biotin carboxyl carrier protein
MNASIELLLEDADGKRVLRSSGVGHFIAALRAGSPAAPGDLLGLLCVLGREHELRLPPAAGTCIVRPREGDVRRLDVGYGDVLFELEAFAPGAGHGLAGSASGAVDGAGGLPVPATQTGRYYDRPAPDRPPFVRVGDELHAGQPIGLIEVMKTFNQLVYGGPGLPARARVLALRCANETEVRRGQELLRVEPLS